MKKGLLLIPVCAGMMLLYACTQPEESAEQPAETTAAAAVTTTTVTTTTETTTVTTTTTVDYQLAEQAVLAVDADSVRPTHCTFTLTNEGTDDLPYEAEFRIIDPAKDRELAKLAGEFAYTGKAGKLGAGAEKSFSVDWTELYGSLPDGTYFMEQIIELPAEEADSDGKPRLRRVVRGGFEVNSDGFVPKLIISPDSVTPEGVTLTVQNSPDAARSYGMVYRLYDESGENRVELLREIDTAAQLAKNYHMEAGAALQLKYSWSGTYGSLAEGEYAIEIELLVDGEKTPVSYRAVFVIE